MFPYCRLDAVLGYNHIPRFFNSLMNYYLSDHLALATAVQNTMKVLALLQKRKNNVYKSKKKALVVSNVFQMLKWVLLIMIRMGLYFCYQTHLQCTCRTMVLCLTSYHGFMPDVSCLSFDPLSTFAQRQPFIGSGGLMLFSTFTCRHCFLVLHLLQKKSVQRLPSCQVQAIHLCRRLSSKGLFMYLYKAFYCYVYHFVIVRVVTKISCCWVQAISRQEN